MKPHNFYLDDKTAALLRELAERQATSAAAIVRAAIREKAAREAVAEDRGAA